jgi:hypothetical protein
MRKKKVNSKIFLVLSLIILSSSLVFAIDTVSTGFKMNGGDAKTINAHGICKIVYDEIARNIFVPTGTKEEWQSFITNKPYGIVLNECPYCGDGSCNNGETCSSCSADCGACPPVQYCGNGVCDGSENNINCPQDCSYGYDGGPGGQSGGNPGGTDAGAGSGSSSGGGSGSGGIGSVTGGENGLAGEAGSAGAGGAGGKVICTEVHRLGYISDEFYNADVEYAKENANYATMLGYHSWAKPFVRVMSSNPKIAIKAIPLAVEWSKHSAYEMGITDKDSEVGKTLLETAIPLCEKIGNMMIKDGNEDYQFDEDFVKEMGLKYLRNISSEMDPKEFKKDIESAFSEADEEYLKTKNSYKDEKKNFWDWFF